jgi:PAS domain-containing protein
MTSNLSHKNLLYKQLHFELLTKLYKSSSEDYENIDDIYKTISESAINGLSIDRASFWEIIDNKLVCKNLYDTNKHSIGDSIESREIPKYIEALNDGIAIVVNDTATDIHTQELLENYLKPLSITDILDLPVRKNGKLVGVFCCEHRDDPREWSESDLAFAKALCDILSLLLEQSERRRVEEEFAAYEKKIHLVTDNSKEWFMVFENRALTYMSPAFAAFFDISQENIQNYSLHDFYKNFHEQDGDKCLQIVNESEDKKIETIRYTYRIKSKQTNRFHWREDSMTIIYDYKKVKSNNKHIIVSRDITELKKSQKRVDTLYSVSKKLNKKILDFTHIVSHDIRSDASNISMLVDIIADTHNEDEKNKYLELLKQSNKKLLDTIYHLNETIENEFLSKGI